MKETVCFITLCQLFPTDKTEKYHSCNFNYKVIFIALSCNFYTRAENHDVYVDIAQTGFHMKLYVYYNDLFLIYFPRCSDI